MGWPWRRGRDLIVGLVVVEGENGQRDRLVEALLTQQSGEDGAHLLEAQGDLAAFLFAGVGDDGEVVEWISSQGMVRRRERERCR